MSKNNKKWESGILNYNNHLEEFRKESETNSDRGVVLVCIAMLDELLADLLDKYFIEETDNSMRKKIFSPSGTLGTFNDKVEISLLLGIISKTNYSIITKLQNIRNKFAHRVTDMSFENNDIKNICSNLEIPRNAYIPVPVNLNSENNDLNPIKKTTPARERFIYSFMFIYTDLALRKRVFGSQRKEDILEYLTIEDLLRKVSIEIRRVD